MQEDPTAEHVADQLLRPVLRQEGDLPDLRVDAVREDEIYDAVLAA
jgi:hypothetical protein